MSSQSLSNLGRIPSPSGNAASTFHPKLLNILLVASIPMVLISVGLCFYFAGLASPPLDSWTPIHNAQNIRKMVLKDHILSTFFVTDSPAGLLTSELEGVEWCSFKTKSGLPMNCQEESMEHRIINQVLQPGAAVLEIGSRWGTLSCEIAKIQNNSGRLLTVEADKDLWSVLFHNQITHQCSFSILLGTISRTPFHLATTPEGQRIVQPTNHSSRADFADQSFPIPSLTLEQAQEAVRMKFDTVIINCGGCGAHFLKENFHQLSKVKVIVIEAMEDINSPGCLCKDCVGLKTWISRLEDDLKFRIEEISIEQTYQLQLFPAKKVYHYVLLRE